MLPVFVVLTILLTNIKIIYSNTMLGRSPTMLRPFALGYKLQHRCFYLWCLPPFITNLLYQLSFIYLYPSILHFKIKGVSRHMKKITAVKALSLWQYFLNFRSRNMLTPIARPKSACLFYTSNIHINLAEFLKTLPPSKSPK